ncbi:hypothetical protein JJB67_14905 [Clostridium perfringens]|uniref:Uncharacterized protein n=2 Tax=Clostridium perfringens TaxID=1502 RepID=A0ABD4PRX8_CLOPF|nr:hypothetical protein [Clostridium perfringens]ELC8422721.1 hypothetical protein [Clostridium perfringens]MBO3304188.1 hypothetical protein [Clostridium perfringens]MBO3307508.1 hypothetical protein [Clostridium perfringens]MBO3310905.1 hypothetical protein [Clostridium perfringens]MBO3317142.1 hypothetical protein [Clostridium perfringens]
MIHLIKEKFLKNKFSIVIILILTIIIIFMQTKLSFKDSKIDNLNIEIKKLQENNTVANNKERTKEVSSKDENNTYFEKLKERFIKIGETKSKTYDENLNGKVVNKFSWIDDFEITDSQIENLLNSLSGEKFKIKFSQTNNSKFNSYKIELIE